MFLNRRRDSFRFTEKKHSKMGIISMLGAIVLVLLYAVFVGRAYMPGGVLSMYYGSVGLAAMLLSGVTMVFSILSLLEENSYMLFPRISLGVSILAVVCWTGTYIIWVN